MALNIKNIIFDLGNVLVDLDFSRTTAALNPLLGQSFLPNSEFLEKNPIFLAYELGHISESDFIGSIQKDAPKASSAQIIDAWNALLLHITTDRLAMLNQLKTHYRVFLLSNTNYTHIKWLHNYMQREFRIENFEARFFEKVYYSHEIHLRKPNVEIYEYVLKDADLNPEETLFIDDNIHNIKGAQLAGISTIWHEAGNEIADIMEAFYVQEEV